jgi:hypothetical protein
MKTCLLAILNLLSAATVAAIDLDGVWEFEFRENTPLEAVSRGDFRGGQIMNVPGCWDVVPEWYMKRGTGCYLRKFTLAGPMTDAVLVVEGMGVRARFAIDGRDLGGPSLSLLAARDSGRRDCCGRA